MWPPYTKRKGWGVFFGLLWCPLTSLDRLFHSTRLRICTVMQKHSPGTCKAQWRRLRAKPHDRQRQWTRAGHWPANSPPYHAGGSGSLGYPNWQGNQVMRSTRYFRLETSCFRGPSNPRGFPRPPTFLPVLLQGFLPHTALHQFDSSNIPAALSLALSGSAP